MQRTVSPRRQDAELATGEVVRRADADDGVLSMAEVVRRADEAQIAYLNTSGRRALARVTSIRVEELCGQRRTELTLRVMPEHLPDYDARAPLSESAQRFRSGDTVGIRYDPRRPKIVAVDRNWVPTLVLRTALG